MRVALTLGWQDHPLDDLTALARAAEAGGYELLLVAEAWARDALITLTYLAGATTRIQLGSGIVNVFSRSPAALAMGIATLDEVSGGRALLGLGISGRGVIEGWHGVPFHKPLLRLREYVGAIRRILRRDRARFDGELIKLAPGFALRFNPPRPEIPIGLAALSPTAIRLAGEVADHWFPYLLPAEQLAADLEILAEGLGRAGRPPSACTVAPYILTLVDADVAAARQVVKEHIAFYVGGMGQYYHQVVTRAGFGSAADQIRAEWDGRRREAAVAAVPDELVDAVGACGSAEHCRRRLADYLRAGADLPVIYFPQGASRAQMLATVAALAPNPATGGA